MHHTFDCKKLSQTLNVWYIYHHLPTFIYIFTSCWFQPLWKIISQNGNHFPRNREWQLNIFETTHPVYPSSLQISDPQIQILPLSDVPWRLCAHSWSGYPLIHGFGTDSTRRAKPQIQEITWEWWEKGIGEVSSWVLSSQKLTLEWFKTCRMIWIYISLVSRASECIKPIAFFCSFFRTSETIFCLWVTAPTCWWRSTLVQHQY